MALMAAGFFRTASSRERSNPEKSLRSSLAKISSTSPEKGSRDRFSHLSGDTGARIKNDERFHKQL